MFDDTQVRIQHTHCFVDGKQENRVRRDCSSTERYVCVSLSPFDFTNKHSTHVAPRVMDTLMRVHGHELLVDGCFNADPHAGNFLLLPDDRIGLIDYGATKTLTREERLITCIMYAALARKDSQMILDVSVASGYKSKHMDKDVIMKLVRLGFDTFGRDLLGDKNTQQFIDELYAKDPYVLSSESLTTRLKTAAARTTDTKKWLIIL